MASLADYFIDELGNSYDFYVVDFVLIVLLIIKIVYTYSDSDVLTEMSEAAATTCAPQSL